MLRGGGGVTKEEEWDEGKGRKKEGKIWLFVEEKRGYQQISFGYSFCYRKRERGVRKGEEGVITSITNLSIKR